MWIQKKYVVLFTIKKNIILLFAGKWIELENIMLNEVSQDKDKCPVLLRMWKLDL
jgi:hypothetical protein